MLAPHHKAAGRRPVKLRDQAWRYTARPEWSSDGESMWMRLSKFSLCNRLSTAALADLFAADKSGTEVVDLRRANRWDLHALAAILEISADAVRVAFCTAQPWRARQRASTDLRYCPACLTIGFHAAWFQWVNVERCPLHGVALQTACVRCAAPIPYALGHALASHPLSCPDCGCSWVPSISRPAGRCIPLDRHATRLLKRWAVYVDHIVGDDPKPPRDSASGRFVATAARTGCTSARAHPLTMLSQMFDAPPPLPVQLMEQRASRPRRPPGGTIPPVVRDDRRALEYDRRQWPHFSGVFEDWEHLLRGARRQWFGPALHECENGRWQHLLGDSLTVPAVLMPISTAAALGWAVSWIGAAQALAPAAERAAPALGLAAWSASLPLRPPGTPRRRWHAQVLAWLNEDLGLSAWMWSQIAGFMRAKAAYLLHGATVNPRDLARLHCA